MLNPAWGCFVELLIFCTDDLQCRAGEGGREVDPTILFKDLEAEIFSSSAHKQRPFIPDFLRTYS